MTQALITINAVPGSDDDLPIGVLVQLSNQNIGGELTYLWAIIDQPQGVVDSLSSTTILNPTFTPRKEGSYLLRLIVNLGLPDEQRNQVVAAVRQLKTLERVPAAGETTEVDVADGWATPVDSLLRRLDSQIADPGTLVGVNASGSTRARGDVLRVTSGVVIKSGLPGQETLPGFVLALATSVANLDELLCVMDSALDGSLSVASNGLMRVRFVGRIPSLPLGAGAVGDSVYVSNAGAVSATPGTYKRRIGSIMAVSGGNRDVWIDGVGGQDITPIDAPYVLYGADAMLLNPHRIDGLNASGALGGIPHVFKAGDISTIALVAKRWGSAGASVFQAQDETGAAMLDLNAIGTLDLVNHFLVRAVAQNYSSGVAAFVIKRLSIGTTGNLLDVQDQAGTTLMRVEADGTLHMLDHFIRAAIAGASGAAAACLRIRRFSAASTGRQLEFQTDAGGAIWWVNADGSIDLNTNYIQPASTGVPSLTVRRATAGSTQALLSLTNETGVTPLASVKSSGEGLYPNGLDMNSTGNVSNVPAPTLGHHAANRDYVDEVAASRASTNLLCNSTFDFMQRGASSIVVAATPTYVLDRWLSWFASGTSLSPTAGSNDGAQYAGLTFTSTGAGQAMYLSQEIDRAFIQQIRGRPLVVSFWVVRVTAGWPNSLDVRFRTGTVETERATPTYATGDQSDLNTTALAIPLGSLPPTFAQFAYYSFNVPALRSATRAACIQFRATATAAGTNAMCISRVMVHVGTVADEWRYLGGSYNADLNACRKFYEKTYEVDTPPRTSNAPGYYSTLSGATASLTGTYWKITHPRFRVSKYASPTITLINYVIPEPVVSSWTFNVTNWASIAGAISQESFEVLNNTGASQTPAASRVFGHWTAESEI